MVDASVLRRVAADAVLPPPPVPVGDLADYQHEVQGYAFGTSSTPHSGIRVESWSGLGRPEQRTGDVDAPDSDGSWFGPDYLGPRTFSWTAHLVGVDDVGAMALHDALADAWTFKDRRNPLAVATYRFKVPGRPTHVCYGRPRRFDAVFDQVKIGLIDVVMDFVCGDPLVYDNVQKQNRLSLGAGAAGGVTLPITLPLTLLDPALPGATQTMTNDGNAPTFPVIRFSGPVTGPRLDNQTTGAFIDLAGYYIPAGSYVDIDTHPARRTVLLNGSGNAFRKMKSGSTFWTLAPGANDLRFSADTYSSAAAATVTARSAWER